MVGFDHGPKPLAREQFFGPKSAHTKRSHQYPDVRRSVLLPAAMGTTLFAGSSEDADCVNMWSFAEEEKNAIKYPCRLQHDVLHACYYKFINKLELLHD